MNMVRLGTVFLYIFCHYFASVTVECAWPTLSNKTFCGFQHTDDYVRVDNETSVDEFPWLAALVYKFLSDGTKAVLCSGTLINRRYVLTAAQCLANPRATVLVGIRLGEYSVKSTTDCMILPNQDKECAQVMKVDIEEKLIHPDYDQQARVNDIALLRLNRRIREFSDFVRPICLFAQGPRHAQVGDTLYITGWGRKLHNAEPAEIKKKILTRLIRNEECAKEFISPNIVEAHMCTRDLESNSEFTCQGDAGAPVMFVSGSLPQWHLEGVSTWGGRCGSEYPRVHTRVSKYLKWIQESIHP